MPSQSSSMGKRSNDRGRRRTTTVVVVATTTSGGNPTPTLAHGRMLPRNIPALPPVANANAQALLPQQALPVPGNRPLQLDRVREALREAHGRRALHQAIRTSVTEEEVRVAEERALAIVEDHNRTQYPIIGPAGAAGAPAWFQLAMQQQQQTLLQQLRPMLRQQQQRTLRQQQQHQRELRWQLRRVRQRIENEIRELRAMVVNAERKSTNSTKMRLFRNDRSVGAAQLQAYIKTDAQNGAGFMRRFFRPIPIVAVGDEIPSPPFPAKCAATCTMTRQNIHVLAVLMNNDFGITNQDTVALCRSKMRDYLFSG